MRLESNNRQGFVENKSCETNLIFPSDRITGLVDRGAVAGRVGLGWRCAASSCGRVTCPAGRVGDFGLSFRGR